MKVSVIGTGYVGLVSGACLAAVGHRVVCVDIDRAKVDAVNAGQCPIHEAGLPEMIARHAGKALRATTDLASAICDSELTLIAAPTPFDGHSIDLTYVRLIAEQIGAALRRKASYHTVAVKSTVVPGTTDSVIGPAVAAASGKVVGRDFGLGMNPEFLSEGVAVNDFMHPDRIVIGGADERTRDALSALYEPFQNVPIVRVNNATAEMVKYVSNALQATMISFANELADLCEAIGDVDASDVMRGVHAMKELTARDSNGEIRTAGIAGFLWPGCGFGGSCFPKDLKAITAHARRLGVAVPLLDAVIAVNSGRPHRMVQIAEQALGGLLDKRIAVLGLAFKPGTDDLRESPAIPVIRELQRRNAIVAAYDPVVSDAAINVLGNDPLRLAGSIEEAVADADAVLLVTAWPEFRKLPDIIASSPHRPSPLLVDGRRIIDWASVPRYRGIGLRRMETHRS